MASLVGAPKHLSDLARIHADVRITCRKCGFEDDWTRGALARRLLEVGGSQVWSEITRRLRCRRFGCGSSDLSAVPVPYARRAANMRRRISKLDAETLAAALGVLDRVVCSSCGGAVATLEVRLSLLVVYAYSRDRESVRRFWERASVGGRTVDDGLVEPLRAIRHRLVGQGWIAPAVLLEEARTWPWDSPAPPGWGHSNPSRDADKSEP